MSDFQLTNNIFNSTNANGGVGGGNISNEIDQENLFSRANSKNNILKNANNANNANNTNIQSTDENIGFNTNPFQPPRLSSKTVLRTKSANAILTSGLNNNVLQNQNNKPNNNLTRISSQLIDLHKNNTSNSIGGSGLQWGNNSGSISGNNGNKLRKLSSTNSFTFGNGLNVDTSELNIPSSRKINVQTDKEEISNTISNPFFIQKQQKKSPFFDNLITPIHEVSIEDSTSNVYDEEETDEIDDIEIVPTIREPEIKYVPDNMESLTQNILKDVNGGNNDGIALKSDNNQNNINSTLNDDLLNIDFAKFQDNKADIETTLDLGLNDEKDLNDSLDLGLNFSDTEENIMKRSKEDELKLFSSPIMALENPSNRKYSNLASRSARQLQNHADDKRELKVSVRDPRDIKNITKKEKTMNIPTRATKVATNSKPSCGLAKLKNEQRVSKEPIKHNSKSKERDPATPKPARSENSSQRKIPNGLPSYMMSTSSSRNRNRQTLQEKKSNYKNPKRA
ncbi:unnamed protein product [[Candida] boidinii]|uniref:Unnamed protein product n=1 Tax=Candida boidinii TaxID=5477 RepID=A0A9W6T0T3_CANBO|nr:hypothetical protein B5S30_g46 [[Candida] boidinii]OWB82032.1 hypothetical protein B5S33_g653 [[Candida] boidinii]GME73063.1 unnamed protein product [[Candida] boidinii]GMF98361.1 unnamed protein product [[Candida] boidinii]